MAAECTARLMTCMHQPHTSNRHRHEKHQAYLEVPYYPKHTRMHARTHTRTRKVKSMAVAPYCTKERSCLDLLRLHLLDEPSPAHTGSH